MRINLTLTVGAMLVPLAVHAQSATLWTPAPDMVTARSSHTATVLSSGKVLLAGGVNRTGATGHAELYDPDGGAWSPTGPMGIPRFDHVAALLPSGKVLVAGGVQGTDGCAFHALSAAELYDPSAGTWSTADPLGTARVFHTATVLGSGKVLVVGGKTDTDAGTVALSSAELYDPALGTWSPSGSLATGRLHHTATLLPSGQVLVAGGAEVVDGGCNTRSLGSAELYDPVSGTWRATGALVITRGSHTATLLPAGRVLVAGGCCGPGGILASAELYDPDAGMWSTTGSLAGQRWDHVATLTPSGKVLVEGGNGPASGALFLGGAELYEPTKGTWRITDSMPDARFFHTATVIPSSGVLVAGGAVPLDGGSGNVAFSVASTLIYAGETLAISPQSIALSPGARHVFTVSGGSGSGYVWGFAANASGGTVSQTGEYVAGSVGHVTDYVSATDSAGNTATAAVLVGAPAGASGGGGSTTTGCSSAGDGLLPLALLLGPLGWGALVRGRRRAGR